MTGPIRGEQLIEAFRLANRRKNHELLALALFTLLVVIVAIYSVCSTLGVFSSTARAPAVIRAACAPLSSRLPALAAEEQVEAEQRSRAGRSDRHATLRSDRLGPDHSRSTDGTPLFVRSRARR